MLQPYIINSINAIILIIVGLIVYFIHPERPMLALVAPGLGIMLLASTYHLKKHNRFVTHTVTALTLLAAVVIIMRLNAAGEEWDTVHALLFFMGLSCLLTAGVFIGSFIKERRLRNNRIYKDDL